MTYERHYLAGWTDYTGVSLQDITTHLRDWEKSTTETIVQLEKYRATAEEMAELLENPKEVVAYLTFFIDLFSRYLSDVQRLLHEIPSGVTEAHLEIIKQLYRSSTREDDTAVRFKNNWVYKSLPHEEMRPLLDSIYGDTRDMLMDYRDLSNVIPRLQTFLGIRTVPTEVLPDFHLKPNFFGVGLNLNRLLARVQSWWKSRR